MKEIKILPVTFALTAVLFTSGQKFFAAKKQNIILILADDMSYFDLSCLGQKNLKLPTLINYIMMACFLVRHTAEPPSVPRRVVP